MPVNLHHIPLGTKPLSFTVCIYLLYTHNLLCTILHINNFYNSIDSEKNQLKPEIFTIFPLYRAFFIDLTGIITYYITENYDAFTEIPVKEMEVPCL
jgi:hypothetical protein